MARGLRSTPRKIVTQKQYYGENLRMTGGDAHPHEATLARNVMFPSGSSPVSRYGRKKYNSVAIPHGIASMCGYAGGILGTKIFIDGKNGYIYSDDNLDGSYATEKTGMTGAAFSSVQINDQLFRCNGFNMIRWNGSSFVDWFKSPSYVACQPTDYAAGNLDGLYQYVFTAVRVETIGGNTYTYESKPFAESAALSVTNRKIRIFSKPNISSDTYWTSIRMWRIGGTLQEYRLHTTWSLAAFGALIVIDDDTADADMSAEVLDAWGNAAPPRMTKIVEKNGQIFGIGNPAEPHRMYYSKAHQPLYFPDIDYDVPYYTDFGENDNHALTAICLFMDGVIVSNIHKIYYFPITTPPYEKKVITISESIGCTGAMIVHNGILKWVAVDGVYAWDGSKPLPWRISEQVDTTETGGMYEGLAISDMQKINFAIPMKSKCLWMSVPSKSKTWCENDMLPDSIIKYDHEGKPKQIPLSKWSENDFSFTCFFRDEASNLLITGNNDGYYTMEEFGTTDNGSAVTSYYYTQWNDYDMFSEDVQIFMTTVEAFITVPITMDTEVRGGSTDSVTLGQLIGGLWNVDMWDIGVWAGGTGMVRKKTPMPQTMAGHQFRVKFYGYSFALYNHTHELIIKKMRVT